RLGLSACCIVYPSSTKRRHATPNLLGLKPLEATGASVHAIALVEWTAGQARCRRIGYHARP
ncbi:hypothetical protein, partial [Azotobacter chroococcum]|uniref:hypothetical protein n=1 Tax=Azotobacter chroococcum TaxID=353 RepID=UPI001A9517EC